MRYRGGDPPQRYGLLPIKLPYGAKVVNEDWPGCRLNDKQRAAIVQRAIDRILEKRKAKENETCRA